MPALSELPPQKPISYAQVRNEICDGDIVLFSGEREVSKMIARFSHGAYSHVGLVLTWYGRRMLLSAEMPKIQVLPLGVAVAGYPGRVDWYRLVPEARAKLDCERLAVEALVNLGIEYGTTQLASLAAHYVLGVRLEEKDDEPVPKSMVCSQYVSRCFRRSGVDLSPLSDIETVPGEIAGSALLTFMGTLQPDHKGRDEARLNRSL
jgi:hypothetical protein